MGSQRELGTDLVADFVSFQAFPDTRPLDELARRTVPARGCCCAAVEVDATALLDMSLLLGGGCGKFLAVILEFLD